MIYSPSTTAALGIVEDAQPEEPLTLRGEGLWVCLISSGKCVVSLSDLDPMPTGSALLLPPQNAAAGHLVLSRGPLTLAPENECHLLCVQLTGQAAEQFLAGLSEMPFLARGETCPAAAELMGRLAEERDTSERVRSQLAFALLCELSDADSAAPALPPLVAAAIEDIRRNYAGLYGVEELSERLGVSKSHLAGAVPHQRPHRSRHASAAPPGVHAGCHRQPLRFLGGQLPLPRLQKNDRPISHAVAGDGRSERTARAFARAAAVGTGIVYLVRFFRFSRKRVRQAVMASEAGNAAQTPFIPKRALSTREQATMATMPRESDVAEASAGRSTAPR